MNIDKKAPAKLLSHEFECYLIVFEKPCFKSSHPFVIYKNQSVDIQSNMKIAPWSFGILPQEHLWNISCQHSWHLLLMLFHPNLAHRHMIYWNLFKNLYEIIQKFVWKSIWNYWGASLKYFLSTQSVVPYHLLELVQKLLRNYWLGCFILMLNFAIVTI